MPTKTLIPNGLGERAEPETFRARTISATLAVKDIEKSLTWYRDKVGFWVEEKFQRAGKLTGFALKAGDVRIVVNQDDGGTGWDRVKGAGFILNFTTTQDLGLLAEAIKQRGARVELANSDASGTRSLRLSDPDGFKIAILPAK